MNVQLTMKAPVSELNEVAAVPSLETDRSAGAAAEPASSSTTFAASSPALESMVMLASAPFSVSVAIAPPAPEIRAFTHTE